MDLRLIAFTRQGALLARRLADGLAAQGHACAAWAPPRHAQLAGFLPLDEPVEGWAGKAFREADGLIFVCACGIAVRAVAPWVRDKFSDPAVVCVDEAGRFAVSLLSGHVGGANRLAQLAAKLCGGQPVISTATDVNGRFAVDLWAAQQNCRIAGREAAKAVSARLLDGGAVGFCADFPVEGALPEGLAPAESGDLGICVSLDEGKRPFARTLNLVPRIVTAGVGCKRGTPREFIEALVRAILAENNLSEAALEQVCSIDLKKDEPGLKGFCGERGLPFVTYPAERLARVEGEFTPSAFVRSVTGVDNVCERAALAGAGPEGRLLAKKRCGNGVTVALAARHWRIQFT